MARPRSDERRSAILSAAVRVIAAEGLSAATATIAKEAGVSNGSLFTYFPTKADLLNQLYLDIKKEMGAVILEGLSTESDFRSQMFHVWRHWLRWAVSCPQKRRVLAHLNVSDDLTPETRKLGHEAMIGIEALLERSRENGSLRSVPLVFVISMVNAIADTAIDFMLKDSKNADMYCDNAFEVAWRMLS